MILCYATVSKTKIWVCPSLRILRCMFMMDLLLTLAVGRKISPNLEFCFTFLEICYGVVLYNAAPFSVFLRVVLAANIYRISNYVNNSSKLNQSTGDAYSEHKLYK